MNFVYVFLNDSRNESSWHGSRYPQWFIYILIFGVQHLVSNIEFAHAFYLNSNQPKFESNFVSLIIVRQHTFNFYRRWKHFQFSTSCTTKWQIYFNANKLKKKNGLPSISVWDFRTEHILLHHHIQLNLHANNTYSCYVQCFIEFPIPKYWMLREKHPLSMVWFHNKIHLRSNLTNTQLMLEP